MRVLLSRSQTSQTGRGPSARNGLYRIDPGRLFTPVAKLAALSAAADLSQKLDGRLPRRRIRALRRLLQMGGSPLTVSPLHKKLAKVQLRICRAGVNPDRRLEFGQSMRRIPFARQQGAPQIVRIGGIRIRLNRGVELLFHCGGLPGLVEHFDVVQTDCRILWIEQDGPLKIVAGLWQVVSACEHIGEIGVSLAERIAKARKRTG